MANFAKQLNSINGYANLGTLMRAGGYTGGGTISSLGIFNPSGAALIYIHLTENGTTAPVTAADGWPIGTAAGGSGSTFYSDRGANGASLDIGTTWIYATSVLPFNVIITGT